MQKATVILASLAWIVTFNSAFAQFKAVNQALQQRYGENYEEVLQKYGDDPVLLQRAEAEAQRRRAMPFALYQRFGTLDDRYIVRDEAEPNNFFDTSDNINDVLGTESVVRAGEATGGLIGGRLDSGDVDVYRFTVDPAKMYYFAGTHSFLDDGKDVHDVDHVKARLFHMSDLDTTFVVDFNGTGIDKMRGDIIGEPGDGRNQSGDFRMTGWVSPVDGATGEMLTGDFYLWIFNGAGKAGTYKLVAYAIDREPWDSKFEPNQDNVEVLTGGLVSRLPTDAVARTFMLFHPDTLKNQEAGGGYIQANSVYPELLGRGDEDVDHFLFDYKAGHNVIIETMPYFGWYRDNDGTIGPGGSRLSDPRIRVYDGDYTLILFDDDDGAREEMDGPNNIHSRIVLTPDNLADEGITGDTPLWLWVSAWASTTRDPEFGTVNNNDPGRMMYTVYLHQYSSDPAEIEPNNSAAEATSILARADTSSGGTMDAADEDWYRVFLHEVRMYTMFVTDPAIQIELFHESEAALDGTTEMSESLLSADQVSDGRVVGYSPDRSGAYLVKLTGGSGEYQFGVVDKGVIWDGLIAHEPDNTVAEVLALDQLPVGPGAAPATGMIFPMGDLDGYHFMAEAGTDITLTLSGTHDIVSDFAGSMALTGPDGNILGASEDGISLTAPATGTYGVIVQSPRVGFYKLSGGDPFEESEDNNSFEAANLIAVGESFVYEASLTAGDVDYFKVVLEAGKLYSFRSKDNQTGAALEVEFFDDVEGTTLLDESDWANNYKGDNFKIANIIPRMTNTYYLKISGSPGSYRIASRVNADYYTLQQRREPDNSKTEADAQGDYQSFGEDVAYVLSEPAHPRLFGDEDWFRVSLAAGQTLTAEAKPVGNNPDDWNRDTDTKLVIFDESGTTELADDDDGGNDWYSLVSYTAEADEMVYVQVRTSRDTPGADDRSMNRGDYLLNIDVASEEVEPNNTFAEAAGNMLTFGFVDGTFDTDGDNVDIYMLSLQADWIYHFRTVRPDSGYGGGFSARLVTASETGTNLLSEDDKRYNTRYSGDNVKINFIPDEAGDYFLELTGDGEGVYQVGMKGRSIAELKAKGEPNNTVAEADAIGSQEFTYPGVTETYMLFNENFAWDPSTHHVSARWSDDIDIYRYDLEAGDTLVAESSPVDGPRWSRDYDGYMLLLSAAGDTLESNDDGGFDWHSRIEFIAEEAGSYYVILHSEDYGDATDRDPSRGEYNLSVTKMDGTPITITNVASDETPLAFVLNQNYPNPFNPATTIAYAVPEAREVQLTVYNVLGQRVALLVNAFQPSGTYNVQFDASRYASGMYFYQLRAGDFVQTKSMILIK